MYKGVKHMINMNNIQFIKYATKMYNDELNYYMIDFFQKMIIFFAIIYLLFYSK